jgi:8-oxo-dGTP diphosphatase
MIVDREYPSRPIVGVGAVILVSPGDAVRFGWTVPAPAPDEVGVVLVKRRFEPLKGRWSLPGGALEVGETLEEGVAREVAEETGLTVDVGPVVDVFDRILLDPDGRIQYHFVLVDYLCRPREGELRAGSDVDEVVLTAPSRLNHYDLTGKALEVIGKATNHVLEK